MFFTKIKILKTVRWMFDGFVYFVSYDGVDEVKKTLECIYVVFLCFERDIFFIMMIQL